MRCNTLFILDERPSNKWEIKLNFRIQATPYLEHVTAGSVIDRFRRLASKFEGAARLVNVFLLMNRRGMAASPPAIKHHTTQ